MKNLIQLTLLITVLFFLGCKDQKQSKERQKIKFEENWESLKKHTTPEWFRNAKLGIYTHWGPVTLGTTEGGSQWYGRAMYKEDEKTFKLHRKIFGNQNEVGYKDVVKKFDPVNFDAAEWAEIFKNSGAQFAGPVAIHHDNFAMWKSDITRWNVYNIAGVDVTGRLEEEIKKRGMRFLTSFHHSFTWEYFEPSYEYDGANPRYSDIYCTVHEPGAPPSEQFERKWFVKLKEVIDNYHPDLIWFDFAIADISEAFNKKFYTYYFNKAREWGKDVVVTIKEEAKEKTPGDIAVLDYERGRPNKLVDFPWLTDTSVGPWFYTKSFGKRKLEASKFIHLLIDIVSKNGCLLLNVPPKADGTIPDATKNVLLEMGNWLQINGEAIYNTRPWKISGKGPTELKDSGEFLQKELLDYTDEDIRFTKNGNIVYAIVLGWPEKKFEIESFGENSEILDKQIKSINLLGTDKNITWQQDKEALVINTQNIQPDCKYAFAWKIELR